MTRPLCLDLFGRAGGAGEGYRRAGFDLIGVDIEAHDYRPGWFIQDDALAILNRLVANPDLFGRPVTLIHASPPCQAHTNAQKIQGNTHPDLIEPTRNLLTKTGTAYVIENVPGAPLNNPLELCGAMFKLTTYRHRLFESSETITAPKHPAHVARTAKMGRQPAPGEYMHVVGNFANVKAGREAMGIDWAMKRDDLREAIPPAYTQHIGAQILNRLT